MSMKLEKGRNIGNSEKNASKSMTHGCFMFPCLDWSVGICMHCSKMFMKVEKEEKSEIPKKLLQNLFQNCKI